MSCASFEAVIVDLARSELVDADARAGALAHALQCTGCAERMAAERAVSEALRGLADRTSAEEAPARVEANVLAALEELKAARTTLRADASVPPRSAWLWATAAAAAFVFVLWGGMRGPGVAPVVVPQESAVAPVAPAASAGLATASAGDFAPLTYGPPLSELDEVQVVRVQLPTSSLSSFGLTVAGELGETVDADVLVGADGVARAMRIVTPGADESSTEDHGGNS